MTAFFTKNDNEKEFMKINNENKKKTESSSDIEQDLKIESDFEKSKLNDQFNKNSCYES